MTKVQKSTASKPAKLSDTQLIILSEASRRPDLPITASATLKGNAANMAFRALLKKSLIEPIDDLPAPPNDDVPPSETTFDNGRFRISAIGLQAIGVALDGEASLESERPAIAPPSQGPRKPKAKPSHAAKPKGKSSRHQAKTKSPGSKQDDLIALLKRTRGATIDELMTASGWQAHSVRGFMSGTLKAKLGLKVHRTSDPKRGSIYRIVD